MNQQTAKYIILLGLILLVVGVVVYFFGNRLNWIGRLPGDIRVERESFRFYFPITTMILFSLLLTVVVSIIRKLL